jgi:hypothetical protein
LNGFLFLQSRKILEKGQTKFDFYCYFSHFQDYNPYLSV